MRVIAAIGLVLLTVVAGGYSFFFMACYFGLGWYHAPLSNYGAMLTAWQVWLPPVILAPVCCALWAWFLRHTPSKNLSN
jgi:hypothetical protein